MSPELLIEPPVEAEAPAADVEALMEEARRRQRKRRLLLAAAALTAAVLGAVLYFGVFHGGGSVLPFGSDEPSAPSATFQSGWILHQRQEATLVPYAGAGHYVHLAIESWKQTSPPYRTRELTYPAWSGPRVERGSSGRQRYAYDPKSKTIFEDRAATAPSFVDPAAHARRMIESGQWKAKRTAIGGRPVLRVEDEPFGIVTFYDAESYAPVRIESDGFPLKQRGEPKPGPSCVSEVSPQFPQSKTVVRMQTYEYLPPTKENEKLLDIRKQHPSAPTAPAKQMSKQFKSIVNPPRCTPPPAP